MHRSRRGTTRTRRRLLACPAGPAGTGRHSRWRARGACAVSLLTALLLRREDRSTTRRRPARADVDLLPLLVLGPIALVLVVVRQLFTRHDVANGFDVDVFAFIHRLTV